jgi:hypothetical protein
VFEQIVAIQGTSIAFEVYAAEACPVGSGATLLTPPRVIPPLPREPRSPTPTPLASPNSVRVVQNETHYVIVDLRFLQLGSDYPRDRHHVMYTRGKFGELYSRWSPWTPAELPFDSRANLWVCWYDANFNPYCHPIADKRVHGFEIHSMREGDLDSALVIIYPGVWNATMEIIATCSPVGPCIIDIAESA